MGSRGNLNQALLQYNLSFTLEAEQKFGMLYLGDQCDSRNVPDIKVDHSYDINTPAEFQKQGVRACSVPDGAKMAVFECSGRHNFFVWTFFYHPTSPVCLECRDL